jgi:hypothetical protein
MQHWRPLLNLSPGRGDFGYAIEMCWRWKRRRGIMKTYMARGLRGPSGARGATMTSVTIAEIDERLRHLTPEKLNVVYDFVSYLLDRDTDAHASAVMSETVLRVDWIAPKKTHARICKERCRRRAVPFPV